MLFDTNTFIFFTICFIWLVTAWQFLNDLSLGRARRIENKNRELAATVEAWINQNEPYSITFKILIFLSITGMSISATQICSDGKIVFFNFSPNYSAAVLVIASLILGESIAKAVLLPVDIYLLKGTIPFIKALRYTILFPVVFIIQLLQSLFAQLKPEDTEEKTTAEDEIMSLVEKNENSRNTGNALEDDEKMMIKGIFDLDDTPVREIMKPRIDVHGLPINSTPEEAKKEFVRTGHSRIPVYENSIDEIKGIIYAKDFLNDEKIENSTLEELAHKPFFIPESKAIDDLLDEVKRNNTHIAVVIDEYGGTAGIVTLEDIIEEIVGEIRDEYDEEQTEDDEPQWMPDGSVVISARMLISDLNELMEINLPEDEDFDTVGGLICDRLGKIPEIGDDAVLNGNIMTKVLKADKRRVISVSISKGECINDK